MRQRVTRALLVVAGAALLVGVPLVVHAQAREMAAATPNQITTQADAQGAAPSWWSDMATWCASAWQGTAGQSDAAAGVAPMSGAWGGMMMPMHAQMSPYMGRYGQYGHMGTSPMNGSTAMPGQGAVGRGAGQGR